jgi:hypothetical protein
VTKLQNSTAMRLHQNTLIENVKGLKDMLNRIHSKGTNYFREISGHIEGINSKVEAMTEEATLTGMPKKGGQTMKILQKPY